MNMHVLTPTQERLAMERRARLARMNLAARDLQKRIEQREADALREVRQKAKISEEKIRSAIEQFNIARDGLPGVRILKIRELVAKEFGLTLEQLTSNRRLHQFTRARFVYSYIANKIYRYTLVKTAQVIGFYDHTSVLNGVKRYESDLRHDPEIVAIVERIIARVGAP